VTALRG